MSSHFSRYCAFLFAGAITVGKSLL